MKSLGYSITFEYREINQIDLLFLQQHLFTHTHIYTEVKSTHFGEYVLVKCTRKRTIF